MKSLKRKLSHILIGIVGTFSIGPLETRLALQTIDLALDRYHEKFDRAMSEDEIERISKHCAKFLEEHQHIPSVPEMDRILDTYIVS